MDALLEKRGQHTLDGDLIQPVRQPPGTAWS